MKEETSDTAAPARDGFRISNRPLVGEERAAWTGDDAPVRNTPDDLLYVVARDPESLFLYWDVNWTRLFARAGLSARQVHLRVYRGDGSIEGTQEINPFRGHCYAGVAAAGTDYYCELGSFEGAKWTSLARSGRAATPEAGMSDDLSAKFATLPTHLSFQRLLDMFGTTDFDPALLARSVAELQETARALQPGTEPGDWSRLATKLNGANGTRMNGVHAAALSDLVEIALRSESPANPTAEELALWEKLRQHFGGSSWTGASHGGFGGSSPA